MDIIAAKIGANMAKAELIQNQQVGYTTTEQKYGCLFEAKLDLDYNPMSQIYNDGFEGFPTVNDRDFFAIEIDGRQFTDFFSDYGRFFGFGNKSIYDGTYDGTGQDFFLQVNNDSAYASLYAVNQKQGNLRMYGYGEFEVAIPMDKKFIPAMDSITLNGADGKQYKVSVNASGALVAEAIV